MDEAKLTMALTHCMGLARTSQRRVPAIVDYLDSLNVDPTWTAAELADLQRRVIISLADDGDEVI